MEVDGSKQLLDACHNGQIDKVEELLQANVNPNVSLLNNTDSPLLAACRNGYLNIVKALLNAQANPNIVIKGAQNRLAYFGYYADTPLVAACRQGHFDIVEALLVAKANLNALEGSICPLLVACASHIDNTHIVASLVNAGADLTKEYWYGSTVRMCDPTFRIIILALLEAGANPNATNYLGMTPLLSLLTSDGKSGSLTVLHVASLMSRLNNVKALLKVGVDPDVCDSKGEAPIGTVCAAISRCPHNICINETATLLLQHHADPNIADNNGITPLIAASKNGCAKIISTLLKASADPTIADNNGQTPLIAASGKGHDGIISTLLQAGADPNKADNNGRIPLIAASEKGHNGIVSTLLQAGADPNKADNNGRTPLIAASENGHNVVLFLLYFKLVLILTKLIIMVGYH